MPTFDMDISPVNNIFIVYANLAQLAEHFIRNERVVGSTPIVGSKQQAFLVFVFSILRCRITDKFEIGDFKAIRNDISLYLSFPDHFTKSIFCMSITM